MRLNNLKPADGARRKAVRAVVLEAEEIRARSQDRVVTIKLASKVDRCLFRDVSQNADSDRWVEIG